MKIKVLEKTLGCMPVDINKGDWFDLVTAEEVTITGPIAHTKHLRKEDGTKVGSRDVVFNFTYIPFGVAMQLPKGFEAMILPRSSTFGTWGLLQTNSEGVIDNTYCGPDDEWKLPVIALKTVTIPRGTRLAQFRIQPSQKASSWQKLKWLCSSKVTFEKISILKNPNRGGFGNTGTH